MYAFLLLLAEASATPAVPSRGDLRTIFAADDYPQSAQRLSQEGDVQARLTVGADGRPTECKVVVSSGSPALDSATCEILLARARFTPARDSSGQPAVDYVTTPKIAWRLTGPQLASPALFSEDDYPKAAVMLGQEGSVEAGLKVGIDGRVSDCTIIQSSGYSALDAATCRILTTRARYTLDRDSQGRPTGDQDTTQKITWVLDGNELPVASWTIRLLVALDDKGVPRMCAIRSGGALKNQAQWTIPCADLSGAFTVPSELASRYAGRKTTLIFDQQFVPRAVNSIDPPRDLKKYPLVSRDVLRFAIDAQGLVSGCRKSISEGSYTPPVDGCLTMSSRRFQPDTKRGGAIPATATTAIYAYVR